MRYLERSKEIKIRLIKNLKEKGYKLTPQRLEVIDYLTKDTSHASAMDIIMRPRSRS